MSRKFFGTDGVRGRANSYPMTADFCLKLGAAAGSYFGEQIKNLIVLLLVKIHACLAICLKMR